jgi:hypothetical protein
VYSLETTSVTSSRCRSLPCGAAARRANGAARSLRAVVRDQSSHRASARGCRRARRGAHGRLGDPRRCPAEDGDVRLHDSRFRCSRMRPGSSHLCSGRWRS